MRRNTLLAALVVSIAFAPVLQAQWWTLSSTTSDSCASDSGEVAAGEPFGTFHGHPRGFTDATDQLPLAGWALDDNGVDAVDILVDGVIVGRARYGRKRPDVAAQFPGFPDTDAAGFRFNLDTTKFLNGPHQVSALVRSADGGTSQLNIVVLNFNNNTHNLRPFGRIDFPDNNAELDGNCDVLDPDRRFAVIEGWVVDAGDEVNDHGVGYVELLLDGAFLAHSRISCTHSPITGAFTNCYGLPRLDIERQFPWLKDAPHAGFRFVIDVGALITNLGYTPGHHWLTIRSGDLDNQVSNVDSIVVNFSCEDFFVNQDSFGNVAGPGSGLHSGNVLFKGWALDREGVKSVRVFVDGVFVGRAAYGFTREGVTSRFPGYINAAAPGWMFTFDTTTVSDGPHVVLVRVFDAEDNVTIIGESQRFIVKNEK